VVYKKDQRCQKIYFNSIKFGIFANVLVSVTLLVDAKAKIKTI
jgi:hypothetical protein